MVKAEVQRSTLMTGPILSAPLPKNNHKFPSVIAFEEMISSVVQEGNKKKMYGVGTHCNSRDWNLGQ
jgi:hypothetical protein